jgi:hypothetical protein
MNKKVKIYRTFRPQPLRKVFQNMAGLGGKRIINEIVVDWAIANMQNCNNVRYYKRVKRADRVKETVSVYCHEVPEDEKCDWCRGLIQNIPLSQDDLRQLPCDRRALRDNA